MDIDSDVPGFSNHCRLFPLPDLVFFPHTVLPLHIFEPRYRQMTADALAGDRLVTMVQIRPAPQGSPLADPVPIMDVGCLGKIVRHQQVPDGRFNIVLLGQKRVRLKRELSTAKLYRIAEAEILEDQEPGRNLEQGRTELIDLFRAVLGKRRCLDENLEALLNSAVRLGVLTDIIAHALPLPVDLKQELLSQPQVARRFEQLQDILQQIADDDDDATAEFPAPFSLN